MRSLIAGLALVLCATAAHAQSPATPNQAAARPNIVFIMTDDHAAHAISAYGSKVNETPNMDRLAKMLEMGQSRPWPDALEALTGERKMDATAMLDYFKPLKDWLDAEAAADKGAPAPASTP